MLPQRSLDAVGFGRTRPVYRCSVERLYALYRLSSARISGLITGIVLDCLLSQGIIRYRGTRGVGRLKSRSTVSLDRKTPSRGLGRAIRGYTRRAYISTRITYVLKGSSKACMSGLTGYLLCTVGLAILHTLSLYSKLYYSHEDLPLR